MPASSRWSTQLFTSPLSTLVSALRMDQLAPPLNRSSRYATLSLSKTDRIRFLHFPEEIYRKAEAVLIRSWPPGIQAEACYGGAYEYRLRGRPWGTFGKVEAIGSRELLRSVLAYLYDRGWVLTTSINLSEKVRSKDTLLFKKTGDDDQGSDCGSVDCGSPLTPSPSSALPPVDWMVVQFSHANRIFLHGHEAEDLIAGFRALLTRLALLEKGEWSNDAYEFSLKGTPWRQHGEKSMRTRVLLLEIAEELDRHGWQSYGTIRQRTDTDDWKVCDSWYLIRPVTGGDVERSGSSGSGSGSGSRSASDSK